MPDVVGLFDEYAQAYARGEHPQARDYLARAGPAADELATLIENFLRAAPAPKPDPERAALFEAWMKGDPPILELRTRRGLRRDQVVDALMNALSLAPAKRDKVKRYYHELETGLLEPRGVHASVWEALANTLKARASDLRALRPLAAPAPPPPAAAYFRATRAPEAAAAPASPPPSAKRAEEDIVDRLFRGGFG